MNTVFQMSNNLTMRPTPLQTSSKEIGEALSVDSCKNQARQTTQEYAVGIQNQEVGRKNDLQAFSSSDVSNTLFLSSRSLNITSIFNKENKRECGDYKEKFNLTLDVARITGEAIVLPYVQKGN